MQIAPMASQPHFDASAELLSRIPVVGGATASGSSMISTTTAEFPKLVQLAQLAKRHGLIGAERSIDNVTVTAEAGGLQSRQNPALGNTRSARDEPPSRTDTTTSSSTEPTDVRTTDSSHVSVALPEASSIEPTWPDEVELFDLGVAMLTGGSGIAVPPTKKYAPAKASYTYCSCVSRRPPRS